MLKISNGVPVDLILNSKLESIMDRLLQESLDSTNLSFLLLVTPLILQAEFAPKEILVKSQSVKKLTKE